MRLSALPGSASWIHCSARSGYEVAFFAPLIDGMKLTGQTTANEASALWSVEYDIDVDREWRTRRVRATNLTATGTREIALSRSSDSWTVDGMPRPDLDGCRDVDFESSVVTNTLPVHRIEFASGEGVEVPAAFVRAGDLRVERLEQRYTLRAVTETGPLFHYESATFQFECELQYDRAGLVVEYPGIAVREL